MLETPLDPKEIGHHLCPAVANYRGHRMETDVAGIGLSEKSWQQMFVNDPSTKDFYRNGRGR